MEKGYKKTEVGVIPETLIQPIIDKWEKQIGITVDDWLCKLNDYGKRHFFTC